MASGFSDSWVTRAGSDGGGGRRRKGPFEDIVEVRRVRGDLAWILHTRHAVPRPAFCGQPTTAAGSTAEAAASSKSREAIKREVLASDRLRYGLREICQDTGRPMPQLVQEAEAILEEMSHSLNMFAIRGFGFAVTKVMKRLYRGVYVNSEGISKLRKACSEYPVILMPMHRSYADFLLLSLICFDYDLPVPAIASAMDFMGMQFIGSVLRNCGAFFIRRSFATDRLYWLTFVEYVKTHVRDGLHPVEFFIEGTRSRSGKSLYPKTGMLGAILESWFMCEVPDVHLVPVSISYDRPLEERLYAYELLGVPKPKESTSGLFKARALLSEDFGNVHFYFDEPISLRGFAAAHGGVDRGLHSLAPKVKAQLTDAETQMLKAVAHHVVARHCANAVVSPFCLVAALMLARAGATVGGRRPLPLGPLAAEAAWLRRQLEGLGASVDWPPGASAEAVIRDHCGLHSDLVRLTVSSSATEQQQQQEEEEEEAVALAPAESQDLTAQVAMGLRLCSYRNQLMCHLVSPALAVCLRAGDATDAAVTIRRLLHREFPTLGEVEPPQSASSTTYCRRMRAFLRASLRPFLIGCWTVCRTLMARRDLLQPSASDGHQLEERRIALAAQASALARLGECVGGGGNGCCWDCASLDLLANAVHGLRRLRILSGGQSGGCDWAALARLTELLESLIERQPEPASALGAKL